MLCLSLPTAISMTLSTRTLLRLCWLPVIFWLHGGLSGAEHVSLRAPVGGESWSAGSVHVIRWDATHIGRNPAVQADFSGDGGTSWNAISTGTLSLSAGTLRWNVPDRVTERCLIRIRNPGSGAVAMNLRPFQITPYPGSPQLSVDECHPLGPLRAARWRWGTHFSKPDVPVRWLASGEQAGFSENLQ